jgi:DNA ligase (NAD+)
MDKFIKTKKPLDTIDEFRIHGRKTLEKCSESALSQLVKQADTAYYNSKPILTDHEYDIIREYIQEKYPANPVLKNIGAPISAASSSKKVVLPYFMGSQDKIKPDTGALSGWTQKYSGPYIISYKLDGVSGLFTSDNTTRLYTRGDGKEGQDISHLIPHLQLPTMATGKFAVRGEFIIPKSVFLEKYQTQFANCRNMISGIINSKTVDERIRDIHFVVYECIHPILKPSEQMEYLANSGFELVKYQQEKTLDNSLLSNILVDARQNYEYEIDGLVVCQDGVFERKERNPEHAFAFKMVLSDQVAEAKVVNVLWSPSKDGYLKPRVQIEPVYLGGVKIEFATGFNAAFILEQKIGIGAVIELVRSGDVIPFIKSVIIPATTPALPQEYQYRWNDTNIDIILENVGENETVLEKNITGFFRGIGVDGLSSGNIAKLIRAGYNSIPKILRMTREDFLAIDGFQDKMSTKLFTGIQEKIRGCSLLLLMTASNLFGRGFSEKKIETIMTAIPDILSVSESREQKIDRVSRIPGMAIKTATAFVDAIDGFIAFLEEIHLMDRLSSFSHSPIIPKTKDHPLAGKTIVLTGFREKELLDRIGSKMGSTVNKNTFVVLVKTPEGKNERTGKLLEARELGIPIMDLQEFREKYGV